MGNKDLPDEKILYSRKQYFPVLEADLEPLRVCRKIRKGSLPSKPFFQGSFLPQGGFAVILTYDAHWRVKAG